MNEVRIEVDDASKTMRVGETLTTGSRYGIVVVGGAASVGTGSLLVFLDGCCSVHGELVAASCSLSAEGNDSTGVLDLSTDPLLAFARRECGKLVSLNLVLHSDSNAENVAVGRATVRLVPVGSHPSTGAANLYKGDKGDAGVGIASISSDEGEDGSTNVRIVLSDGSEKSFSVPKGKEGEPSKTTAVYCPESGLWHQIRLVRDVRGGLAVSIGSKGYAFNDLPETDEPARRAKEYADRAAESAKDSLLSREAAVQASESATQASVRAAESAAGAARAGSDSGAESGRAAAEAKIGEVQELFDEAVRNAQEASRQAVIAASSAASSVEAAVVAENSCKTLKDGAEEAKEEAKRLSEAFNADLMVRIDTDQVIDAKKTFAVSPLVPDDPENPEQNSPSASRSFVSEEIAKSSNGVKEYVKGRTLVLASVTNGSLSLNNVSVKSESGTASLIVLAITKIKGNATGLAKISFDNGTTYEDIDFGDGDVKIYRTDVLPKDTVWCKLKATASSQFRYSYCNYLDIPIPEKPIDEEERQAES